MWGNRRHKQAVSVLNAIDYDAEGNPLGMTEDPSNPASANFGTERTPQRGRCYQGDGTAYAVVSGNNTLFHSINSTWNDWTIEFYINGVNYDYATSAGTNIISTSHFAGDGDGFRITTAPTDDGDVPYGLKFNFYYGDSIYKRFWVGNVLMDAKKFYHVKYTWEGGSSGNIHLYIDGEEVTLTAMDGARDTLGTATNARDFSIGLGNTDNGAAYLRGKVFGIKIEDGIDKGFWKCDEGRGTIAFDCSGADNHADIINAVTVPPDDDPNSWHGYQDRYSYQNQEGFTLSDGISYFRDAGATELIPAEVLIPELESVILPPFKCIAYNSSGERAEFKYKGKVPAKAKFTQSSCFFGNESAWIQGVNFSTNKFAVRFYVNNFGGIRTAILSYPTTSDNLFLLGSGNNGIGWYNNNGPVSYESGYFIDSALHQITYIFDGVNGYIYDGETQVGTAAINAAFTLERIAIQNTSYPFDGDIWDLRVWDLTGYDTSEITFENLENLPKLYHLPLCEPIADPSTHTYYDITGNGNHAILVNGLAENETSQDEYHYLQKGFLNSTQIVPILEDGSAFADGTPLSDANAVLQDSKTFLNTGETIQHYDMPALRQADGEYKIWYDETGALKSLEYDIAKFGAWYDKYYSSNELPELNQIVTYMNGLSDKHDYMEKIIRNTTPIYSINAFVATFRMTDNETLVIPATSTNDFWIDWGDGSPAEHITTTNPSHTYAVAGDYQVVIEGKMTRLFFYNAANKLNLISIEQGGNTGITTADNIYNGCSNLTEIKGYWNTSGIANFFSFAYNCSKLTIIETSSWNTQNVTNFNSFAVNCSLLTELDVSGFKTQSVTDFMQFIHNCSSLTTLDVSGWDTQNVISFKNFAYSCSSLTTLDVSAWNTQNVDIFQRFTYNCSSLTDIIGIENWDVSSCTIFLDFATNVTLPTSRYDAVLNVNSGWISRTMQDGAGESIDFGNSKYTDTDTDVTDGRTAIENKNWVITDGGPI